MVSYIIVVKKSLLLFGKIIISNQSPKLNKKSDTVLSNHSLYHLNVLKEGPNRILCYSTVLSSNMQHQNIIFNIRKRMATKWMI